MDYMVNQARMFEYVRFTMKNLYNFMNASYRDQIFESNSKSTLTYLSIKVDK